MHVSLWGVQQEMLNIMKMIAESNGFYVIACSYMKVWICRWVNMACVSRQVKVRAKCSAAYTSCILWLIHLKASCNSKGASFKMLMHKNYQGIPGNRENIVPCIEEDTDVQAYVEKKGTEKKYPVWSKYKSNFITEASLGKNVVCDALHFCITYESAATLKTKQLENLIQFNSLYIFLFPESHVM